ncbi:hypothetical protein H4R18_000208 [Coemansia javaensis]|uniref:Uncharacterized protein n=1 Tax=Coemansia javaensis TaxID=2761396 RepID=A0A9W8HQB5_9FUNG|nr:hypothetical protein H4R18_000208 [Coemansia javaensis]
MAAGTWMHDSAIMTLPKEIRFQIKDATNDLTHFAHAAEFLFEGDPAPLGDDDGQLAVVVDMSPDGTRPVGVRSLTSSLMVSGFEWKPEAADGDPAAALMVDGVSLQKR